MQLESTILFFAYRIQISRIHPDGIIREIRLWLRKKCPHGFVLFVRFVFLINTPRMVFIKVRLQKKLTDSNNLFIQPWSRHWITRLLHGFSMPIILTKTKRDFRKIQSNFRKWIWGFVFSISISVKRRSGWGRRETWKNPFTTTTKFHFKQFNKTKCN